MQKNLIFLLLILFVFIGAIFCQDKDMIPYDKNNYNTLEGEVISIDVVLNKIMKEDGLHLTIKTSKGKYIVHVCPLWYAENEEIKFEKQESITVSGATFVKDGENNIYAAVIKRKSGKTHQLRNPDSGKGLWGERHREEKKSREPKNGQKGGGSNRDKGKGPQGDKSKKK